MVVAMHEHLLLTQRIVNQKLTTIQPLFFFFVGKVDAEMTSTKPVPENG